MKSKRPFQQSKEDFIAKFIKLYPPNFATKIRDMKKIILLILGLVSFGIGNLRSQTVEKLDSRQQSIVVIAANMATGNLDVLKTALNRGLEAGLTVNEIKEVLIQMYAYCGFPRSLQGLTVFMQVMDERKAAGITDSIGEEPMAVPTGGKYELGKTTLGELAKAKPGTPTGVYAFAPGIEIFLKEHLFADIFHRNILSYSDRELATVAVLASMTGVEPMLQAHIGMCRNTGISDNQLRQLIEIIRPAAGITRAESALNLLTGATPGGGNAVFGKGDKGSDAYFVGEVQVQPLIMPDQIENLYGVAQVTFLPGGRTKWHTHPLGQVLLCTEGEGYYQERGKTAQKLTAGSVVNIPIGVEHWHGAAPDSKFVHIAISNMKDSSNATWTTPVTDVEYEEATN